MKFNGPSMEGLFLSCWKLEIGGKMIGPKIVLEINVNNESLKMT